MRNVDRERADTIAAAAPMFRASAMSISAYAEQRAGTQPIRDHQTRDFATEALEELADARNYLVWWRQQPAAQPAALALIDTALAAVVDAYDAIRTAERTEETLRHAE